MALGDMFKVNQYKQKITELDAENKALKADNAQLDKENESLSVKAEHKLSLIQMKPDELSSVIDKKNKEVDKIKQEIIKLTDDKEVLNGVINTLNDSITNMRAELVDITDKVEIQSYGLYTPRYDFANSLSYKEKLTEVRQNQKIMIKNMTATDIFSPMTLNGSESKGKSMQKKNGKQLLRSFNGESEAAHLFKFRPYSGQNFKII